MEGWDIKRAKCMKDTKDKIGGVKCGANMHFSLYFVGLVDAIGIYDALFLWRGCVRYAMFFLCVLMNDRL
jgi:hypothetical protein